jgi:hypothetical protein
MDDPHQTGLGILTGKLTELARRFVAEHGRFQAFAGAIGRDGEITHLGVDPSIEEPERAIEALAQDIRALDSDAGVVAADVDSCIMVIAEERTGVVTRTFIPYTRGEDGSVVYGEKFSDSAPQRVLFADQA